MDDFTGLTTGAPLIQKIQNGMLENQTLEPKKSKGKIRRCSTPFPSYKRQRTTAATSGASNPRWLLRRPPPQCEGAAGTMPLAQIILLQETGGRRKYVHCP